MDSQQVKKRGRPSKKVLSSEQQELQSNPVLEHNPDYGDDTSVNAIQRTPKKRGRPSISQKSNVNKNESVSETSDDDDKEETTEKIARPVRGRGRPSNKDTSFQTKISNSKNLREALMPSQQSNSIDMTDDEDIFENAGDKDEDEIKDEYRISWVDKIVSAASEARSNSTDSGEYPLISKSNEYKGFRSSFCEFWSKLQSHLLSREFYELIIPWIFVMTMSEWRALRHTSTCAMLQYSLCLVNQVGEKCKQSFKFQQVLKSEKKIRRENPKIAVLEKNINILSEEINESNDRLNDIFDLIITRRYRDSVPEIRIETIRCLCQLINDCPQLFFENKYLKFIGWLFFDKDAKVRLATLKAFLELATKSENSDKEIFKDGGLQKFLEYYQQRLCDVITEKKNSLVTIGYQYLLFLEDFNKNLVSEEAKDRAISRVCSADIAIREAAANYILKQVERMAQTKNNKKDSTEQLLRYLLTLIEEKTAGSEVPDYIVQAILSPKNTKNDSLLFQWDIIYSLLTYSSPKNKIPHSQQVLLAKILSSTIEFVFGNPQLKRELKLNDDVEPKFEAFLYEKLPKLLTSFKGDTQVLQALVTVPKYLCFVSAVAKDFQKSIKVILESLSFLVLTSVDRDVYGSALSTLASLHSTEHRVELEFMKIFNELEAQFSQFMKSLYIENNNNSNSEYDQVELESKKTQFELLLGRLNELNKVWPIQSKMKDLFRDLIFILRNHLKDKENTILSYKASKESVEIITISLINFLMELVSEKSKESDCEEGSVSKEYEPVMDPSEQCGMEIDEEDPSLKKSKSNNKKGLKSTKKNTSNDIEINRKEESLKEKLFDTIGPGGIFEQILENPIDLDTTYKVFIGNCQLIYIFKGLEKYDLDSLNYCITDELAGLMKRYYQTSMNYKNPDEMEEDEEERKFKLTAHFCKLIQNNLLGIDSLQYSTGILIHFVNHGKLVEKLIDDFLRYLKKDITNPRTSVFTVKEFELESLKLRFEIDSSHENDDKEREIYQDSNGINYSALEALTRRFLVSLDLKSDLGRIYLKKMIRNGLSYVSSNVSNRFEFLHHCLMLLVSKVDPESCSEILKVFESMFSDLDVSEPEVSTTLEEFKNFLQDRSNSKLIKTSIKPRTSTPKLPSTNKKSLTATMSDRKANKRGRKPRQKLEGSITHESESQMSEESDSNIPETPSKFKKSLNRSQNANKEIDGQILTTPMRKRGRPSKSDTPKSQSKVISGKESSAANNKSNSNKPAKSPKQIQSLAIIGIGGDKTQQSNSTLSRKGGTPKNIGSDRLKSPSIKRGIGTVSNNGISNNNNNEKKTNKTYKKSNKNTTTKLERSESEKEESETEEIEDHKNDHEEYENNDGYNDYESLENGENIIEDDSIDSDNNNNNNRNNRYKASEESINKKNVSLKDATPNKSTRKTIESVTPTISNSRPVLKNIESVVSLSQGTKRSGSNKSATPNSQISKNSQSTSPVEMQISQKSEPTIEPQRSRFKRQRTPINDSSNDVVESAENTQNENELLLSVLHTQKKKKTANNNDMMNRDNSLNSQEFLKKIIAPKKNKNVLK